MLDIHCFTRLPDDEGKPVRRANPTFNRLVHCYSGRAKLPHLSREYEIELIGMVQDFGCETSLNHLIEAHMGFITNVAVKYAKRSYLEDHVEDITGEATEGFIHAVKKFSLDPVRARLSTYAQYFLVARCLDYAKTMKLPFRVATNVPDKTAYFGLSRIRKEFHEIYRRPMNDSFDDIETAATITGIPARAIKRAIDLHDMPPPFSPEDIQIHDMRAQVRPETILSEKKAGMPVFPGILK